jgi:hypothetical protein
LWLVVLSTIVVWCLTKERFVLLWLVVLSTIVVWCLNQPQQYEPLLCQTPNNNGR